jgi:hypothetical protein
MSNGCFMRALRGASRGAVRSAALLALAVLGRELLWSGSGSCTRFLRGDTNADGRVEAADGLGTLNVLFAGGPAPACFSALDADDSGDVDLSDPIFTFFYLFLQGPSPPEPGPLECGFDPTNDGLSCESFEVCEPRPEERDFSGFTGFEYRVYPALGFCLEVGEVYEASITRKGPGEYRLSLSTVEEGEAGSPECIPDTFGPPCLMAVPQDPRPLTAGEVDRMRQAFLSVTVFHEPDPICHCVAIDPCRIEEFSWDGEEYSSFPCHGERLAGGETASLKDLLRSFAGNR